MSLRDTILDLQGLKCPLPVLHTRKALARMTAGQILVIRCTDPLAAIDIPHFLAEEGHALLATENDGVIFTFRICKA
jgi:tRNA 2-thiouridine synthesizing protein A